MVQNMRTLYHTCHLIHADLSEFNLLYHEGKAYMIDVSQSVEHDHPNALVFLRKDCTNITDFFRRRGVPTMLVKELFDFITDLTITSYNIEQYLDAAMDIASKRSYDGLTEEDKVDEEVFKNVFIPRALDEVKDYEGDVLKRLRGEDLETHYHTVTGMRPDLTGAQEVPKLLENKLQLSSSDKSTDEAQDVPQIEELSINDKDDSDSQEEDESSQEETTEKKMTSKGRPKQETAEERRERKKEVKEARKEKLKTKIPKHVKKRGEKVCKTKKSH